MFSPFRKCSVLHWFPWKQILRWRVTCKRCFGAVVSRTTFVRKGRPQDLAEGEVERQRSCSRSLNQTQREMEIRVIFQNYQKGPSHCYGINQSLGGSYLGRRCYLEYAVRFDGAQLLERDAAVRHTVGSPSDNWGIECLHPEGTWPHPIISATCSIIWNCFCATLGHPFPFSFHSTRFHSD